ncbi:unnamed protein product [Prorocentrum cordatum]|uniref:Uncharacterized protein n=1 Tax=Prorocentrum cordatum TaxID=2364126 RepID=A0ABN9PRV4_9DINO|nr:unnamed protein product [Polarella glacialis]CAK0900593.1 unnamed protein product [Polarella glacialis]
MAAPLGRALLAAAVAVSGRVFGLTAAPLSRDVRGPDGETSREEIDRWLDEASEKSEALEQETQSVLDEIAKWIWEDPQAREEQELEMLEGILSKWDAENETRVEETARRMAAIAFRRELQALVKARTTRPALTLTREAAWKMATPPSKELAYAANPADTIEKSEAGESFPEVGLVTKEFRNLEAARAFRGLAAEELIDSIPRGKKARRRHYRPAPHASKRTREMVAQAIESWLPEAAKETSEIDSVYASANQKLGEQLETIAKEQAADQELLHQLGNVSTEQEEDVVPEADKELAILQGIWDRYEFESRAVSAEDLAESLHLMQDPSGWYSEALRALHQIGQGEPEAPEITRLRETVDRLESDLEAVEEALKEELAQAPEESGPARARASQRMAALRRQTTEAVAAAVRARIDSRLERARKGP